MVNIFLTSRGNALDWRSEIASALSERKSMDPESWPISVVTDQQGLTDADWESRIGAQIDTAELVLLLVTSDPGGGFKDEPALKRSLARAAAAPDRIVPIIVDLTPGFLPYHGLADTRLKAIPNGGVPLAWHGDDRAAWLPAVITDIKRLLDAILGARQMRAPDLGKAISRCEAAALAADDAARREAIILDADLPLARHAVQAVTSALNLGGPLLMDLMRAARHRVEHARRVAEEAEAEETAGALRLVESRVADVINAANLTGRLGHVDTGPAPSPAAFPIQSAFPAPAKIGDSPADTADKAALSEATAEFAEGAEQMLARAPPAGTPAGEAVREVAGAAMSLVDFNNADITALVARSQSPPRPSRASAYMDEVDTETIARQADLVVRQVSGLRLPRPSKAIRTAINVVRRAAAWVADYARRLADRAAGRPVRPDPRRYTPGVTWRNELTGLDAEACPLMVTLPAGRFTMGAPDSEEGSSEDERPLHPVDIQAGVAFSCFPVTFRQWDVFATSEGREVPEDEGWGRGDRPVINVSWEDAHAYVDWLNDKLDLTGRRDRYRLPSEAEWEYACRAGKQTAYGFGETISSDQARFGSENGTTPLGRFPANAFGLHDMHGNVWEWCQDTYHESYEGAPDDGSAWEEGEDSSRRVLRGGSWLNDPQDLRSACRSGNNSSSRVSGIGFRLARTLSSSTS